MYTEEIKNRALLLRSEGRSLREISVDLGIAKSTASMWVKHIPITSEHRKRLSFRPSQRSNQHFFARKRADATQEAKNWLLKTNSSDHLVFASLYWGEGDKSRNRVSVSTSDPSMIRLVISFLRSHCSIDEQRLNGAINISPLCNLQEAIVFWSNISGIPSNQFFKSQVTVPKSSKLVAKHRCPYGTFTLHYGDTILRAKIEGWMKAIGYGGSSVYK